MIRRCEQHELHTLSKTGEGDTEQEAKDAAKAAFDSFYAHGRMDSLKKDAEQDLKCEPRRCENGRDCQLYWNPSVGQYVNDPEKHDGKIRVAYVVVVFF
jgi:hypothetical protein